MTCVHQEVEALRDILRPLKRLEMPLCEQLNRAPDLHLL